MFKNSRTSNFVVDYYQGAYGPTIRVDLVSLESALELLNIFKALAEGTGSEVKLHELETAKVSGLREFVLRVISDGPEVERTLSVVNGENPSVCWHRSRNGWKNCVDLVQVLIDSNSPGHQYLTKEGIDDALVEVSFK